MNETTNNNPDYLGHRQRLKKRFMTDGGKSMPDYEFLELLLTVAIPRRDVKPLAKRLINEFGSFAGVITAPVEDLTAFGGLKENTVCILKIIKGAAIRLNWQILNNSDQPIINSWDAMIDYCRSTMAYQEHEEFRIIFLNSKLMVIGEEIQQRGTIDHVSIHPREVIKSAVLKRANSIILVHNHPSGDVTPSKSDIEVTKKIISAAEAVNIRVIDHIVISKYDYFSFSEHKII